MVVLKRLQHGQQRRRRGLDLRSLARREVVEVLVHGLAGVALLSNPIQARHQHRREGQVRIARRVRRAELDALGGRGAAIDRNPYTRAPVAGGVGEADGSLKARDEAAVGVGGRRGEAQQRRRVLEQAADVVHSRLAEERVAILIVEDRHAVLPQALVAVHPRAIVAIQGLGHERCRHPVLASHLLDHVLVDHEVVRALEQAATVEVDLALSRRRHLMVVYLAPHAHLRQRQHHIRTHVLQRIGGRAGKVALLVPRLEAQVGAFGRAAVPDALGGVHEVVAGIGGLIVPDIAEDEELGLRTPVAIVGDARGLQVLLGLLGDVAGAAAVLLEGQRVMDVADHAHGRDLKERVDEDRAWVREEEHVTLVDILEAADARAVEAQALLEQLLRHVVDRQREVVPCPR